MSLDHSSGRNYADELSDNTSVSTQISLNPDSCVGTPCYKDAKRKLRCTPHGLKLNENCTVLP